MIDSLPNECISPREVDSLRAVVKADTGWEKAKRSGIGAVPQGTAYVACERLLSGLRDINLLVVPVGELERFAPGISGHGPGWVTAVLEQKMHETPGKDAVSFVGNIRDAAKG